MDPSDIALFNLADRRLAWVDQRQQLLAQNIANADTPGFRARDVAPFAAQLAQAALAPVQTNPMHLAAPDAGMASIELQQTARAPDGNGVAVDEQLTKVADTETTHDLVANIYKTYLGLFRTTIGH